ncbi:hypothetical protein E5288_WYG005290 [Bos mutus]|uniref:Uncharacterized protein n=1 Tax=Bos mutus TaxID=72004 RepID=A0A6B0S4I9_9CETA|nr:hypothetical protein [Bos mutus]
MNRMTWGKKPHPRKPYQCPLRGKGVSHPSKRNRQQRIPSEKKLFQCPQLNESLSWSSDPTCHCCRHRGEAPLSCAPSAERFGLKSLELLRTRDTSSARTPLSCPARSAPAALAASRHARAPANPQGPAALPRQ